ncbi:Zinc finger protein VAR3, chloroplastic [Apostasia shenzhenica]|uniref:Zinc finger protein VAR3, chloroplastic n=1 Tax=Apostasia shenzhenica TaxID=1088818 RepID=A0A2I0AUR1_9ASPA|nr:Zinc finger protein VAR3, chloroplastic [Apostasia shenzhenica]
MAFTFLIRRRFRLLLPKLPPPIKVSVIRYLSANAAAVATANPSTSTLPDPKPSLSARLSFVFDQIDALERQRDIAAKDEALQRIRAWRQAKHPSPPAISSPPTVSDGGAGGSDSQITGVADAEDVGMAELFKREVEVVHPWPEWIEFMERLARQNYFDYRRVEEDRVAENAGIDLSGVKEEVGLDLTRDWAAVRTASMNFGRDRFDIFESLSRKDIQILVGHGCPSLEPKVVFSAKLLRKYVHLDEGDEDEARTLDVIRLLLTYGFDHVKETVENSPLRKMKSVKNVVRKLLYEVVRLSAVPRDPNLLPPVIKKPPPKVKQPPPQPKRRVGRDDVEMKKGDWLCPKCNFLNYRRNMSCFHCEHKRPPDDFTENQSLGNQIGPSTRVQRSARVPDVSNAWNFDFDDDESDGADVAAFEYADSAKARDGSPLNAVSHGSNNRRFDDDIRRNQDHGGQFSNSYQKMSPVHSRHTGFDDFDDEEDDDLDSYELDEGTHLISRKSFSELEKDSGSTDFDDLNQHANSSHHRKDLVSDSEDDLVVSVQKVEGKRGSFGYDNSIHGRYDLKAKNFQQNAGLKGSRKTRDSDLDSDFSDELSVAKLDDDDDTDSEANLYSRSNRNGNRRAPERTSERFEGRDHFVSERNGRNSFNGHSDDEFDDREGSEANLYSRSNRNGNSRAAERTNLYSRSNRNGNRRAAERTGGRFEGRNLFVSKRNGRDSFNGHNNDEFDDRGGSDRRKGRANQSSYGARSFRRNERSSKGNGHGRQKDDYSKFKHSFGRTNSGKSDYRSNGRKNNKFDRSRGFDDGYDFRDNNQRRRIIER